MLNDITGLIRAGAASPALKVADPEKNAESITAVIKKAQQDGAGILLLPELALTSATCGDLFFQDTLYDAQIRALSKIVNETASSNILVAAGFFLRTDNKLLNCAAVIQNGNILGIVPKMHTDQRYFCSGAAAAGSKKCIRLLGRTVPFGDLIFEDERSGIKIGIQIGSDMELPVTPADMLALEGADIILNPAASPEIVGSAQRRRALAKDASRRAGCGLLYASSGYGESTSDMLFSGHCLICESGKLLNESGRLVNGSTIIYSELDHDKIRYERLHKDSHDGTCPYDKTNEISRILLMPLEMIGSGSQLSRHYSKTPFIPEDPSTCSDHCREIFTIQTNALARRLAHTGSSKAVVGISGGLDSTLALLVSAKAAEILGKPQSDIIAVTMPGFGTTDRTYTNALTLMEKLGCDVREIPIGASVLQHFADIGHDESVHDITYENSQARERTQILMDLANKEGGLVVGTGDLSEAALGWCTYNGDHMSMYNVNCGIPKTLIRYVVRWVKDNAVTDQILKDTLQSILDTPISPELLPPDESGNIAQKTEENVGPYELNDFFIYHTIRSGMSPAKLSFIAKHAFSGTFDEKTVDKWLSVFYRRFFTQQFKRNCVPDGPKVGSIGLSPRGDWQMPSDASFAAWMSCLG